MRLLMKIDTLFLFSVKAAKRSLVENDRSPSFHGAPEPCKRTETTLAPYASAGVVVGRYEVRTPYGQSGSLRGFKLFPIK
jgi:hypothetical protein